MEPRSRKSQFKSRSLPREIITRNLLAFSQKMVLQQKLEAEKQTPQYLLVKVEKFQDDSLILTSKDEEPSQRSLPEKPK